MDARAVVRVGKLAGSGILTTGEVIYVKKATDPDIAEFQRERELGLCFADIQSALDACVSGRHDYVVVVTPYDNAAYQPASGLQMTKRFVHLVGASGTNFGAPEVDFTGANGLHIGVGVSGSNPSRGCELRNLKLYTLLAGTVVIQIGDATRHPYDTQIISCGVLNLNASATVPEVKDYGNDLYVAGGGSGSRYSYWGTGLVAHPKDIYTQQTLEGGNFGSTTWVDVVFFTKAATTGDQQLTFVTGSLPHLFLNCVFLNVKSTAAMDSAVVAADTNQVFFTDCKAFGCTTLCTAAKGQTAPAGMGLLVASADIFNPALAVGADEPVAADTP